VLLVWEERELREFEVNPQRSPRPQER
jgi:hypothetical protein